MKVAYQTQIGELESSKAIITQIVLLNCVFALMLIEKKKP